VDENVAQVVECLYGKHKDLSSNPHTAKKKRKCKTLNVYELKRVGRDGVEVVWQKNLNKYFSFEVT
jgi:hypothetical protein